MSFQRFCDFLRNEPFVPFEVRLRNGELYQIKDQTQAAVGKSRYFIAHSDSDQMASGTADEIISVERIPEFSNK